MGFNYYEKDGVIVIDIPQRLDASNSQELKDLLAKYVSDKKYKYVMNLSNTEFIDSSGLGAIVSKIAHCRANGGDVKIVVTNERIKEIFNITHLDKVLKEYKTVDEALGSF
ncbi:STAS domain-containing protein [Deferribacter thermophilus]|uniref:STAS domain-containing protein n=1 Tax=Deferribacter thermophilus TaxID=53573 RepID=UPI003C19D3C2